MKKGSSSEKQLLYTLSGLVALSVFFFIIVLVMPVSFNEEWKEIEIPQGASYTRALEILEEHSIISNRLPFLLLAKLTSTDTQLKPGFYNLSASMSPLQIYKKMIEGRTIRISITIPEGSTMRTIKRKLEEAGLIDEISWQLVYDEDFLASLNIDAPSMEGYIYPDTYKFSKGESPRVIFRVMVQRMREMFDGSLRKRAEEFGMTENDVLTLASIVEKEAVHDSERPIIAAVYHNRLKRNMKLQADPTVLYGVHRKKKDIRYRDLKRTTPYNTYVIRGLPPGPIASPGIKSIKAALYPADVDYLFFVSMNNGRHHFSLSGKEHLKAVEQYQINGYNNSSDE